MSTQWQEGDDTVVSKEEITVGALMDVLKQLPPEMVIRGEITSGDLSFTMESVVVGVGVVENTARIVIFPGTMAEWKETGD